MKFLNRGSNIFTLICAPIASIYVSILLGLGHLFVQFPTVYMLMFMLTPFLVFCYFSLRSKCMFSLPSQSRIGKIPICNNFLSSI
jgi:hypothetical protein